ncbi:MAG: flagellar protein [Lachnospiraceae bacterium]|nr:flagellar protein [Lachnospiraceae bacterium]
MKINTNGISLEQAAAAYLSQVSETRVERKTTDGKSFAEILNQKGEELNGTRNVRFSKHAAERLYDRNIDLSDEQLERLTKGTEDAESKGIDSSLVMVDDLAFIVNTGSKTVVTAMDPANNDKNIFTNIDGAVIA